jgi:enamine deaminase RidA (YjgF/YER057c/UK114 family)
MTRTRTSSGAPWEARTGYCRALRTGNLAFVSGTAPVGDDGLTHAPGNAYEQARRCFEIGVAALERLDVEPRHVVRTRMFVTDIPRFEDYARAHQEVFGGHPPVTSMVEVKALVRPDMLIEVEFDAVVD